MRYEDEMMDTDEKLDAIIREELKAEEIPEELFPEKMVERLREQGQEQAENGIRMTKKTEFRAIAVLCACMLMVVGISAAFRRESGDPLVAEKCYMENAGSYGALHEQVIHLAREKELYRENNRHNFDLFNDLFAMKQSADIATNSAPTERAPAGNYGETADSIVTDGEMAPATGSTTHEYSDTLSQVEGIAEADCVKTDGEAIYYLVHEKLFYIEVEDGIFSEPVILSSPTLDDAYPDHGYAPQELYLSNGTAVVIYHCDLHSSDPKTAVVTYRPGEQGDHPVERKVLYQDGGMTTSRMIDGTLYLVTGTSKRLNTNIPEDSLSSYVPCCGETTEEFIPAKDIMIPDDWGTEFNSLNYTVLAAMDVEAGAVTASKAFAGYPADIYMNHKSLYLASRDSGKTKLTRISYRKDEIVPVGVGIAEGNLLNQYSMYEKDDAFFVATNGLKKESGLIISYLTSFDANMQKLHHVEFAEGEQLKAANFSGDRAYVVTFYETDPLFSIDISDPSALKIDDGYKVSGYSTFLYPWNNHLLSFGLEVVDQGRGIKLMMYDTAEDGTMVMLDDYVWLNPEGNAYFYSPALSEYKALYLNAEQNLIGVPVWGNDYVQGYVFWGYEFFRYDEAVGEFVRLASVPFANQSHEQQTRCVAIDDYLYLLNPYHMLSVRMADFESIDFMGLPNRNPNVEEFLYQEMYE